MFNIVHYFFEAYLINRLNTESIHNDLGASFTSIQRSRRNHIVKRASPDGEQKLREEIEWNLRFARHPFGRFLPQIFSHSLEPGSVAYDMRYYTWPNLRAVIMTGMNARFFVRFRLMVLIDALRELLWTEAQSCAVPEGYVDREHFVKYDQRRLKAIEMVPGFARFMDPPVLLVNGKKLVNADVALSRLRSDPEAVRELTPDRLYYSHGDVHCNNILCGVGGSQMILLDCRGKSPAGTDYYDVAYDLGKLFHDFRSLYSLIERHSYSIFHEFDGDRVSIEYRFTDERMRKEFHYYSTFIRFYVKKTIEGRYGNALRRASFTEAMLYLTMIPMHLRMKDEGLMCYVTGVRRLNEWLVRYHPDKYASLCEGLGIEPEERIR
jgi:hypothetical protein